MSVKGVEVPEKVVGFFRWRGPIFQKWVTNFWTDSFDEFFPWNFRSFVHILGTKIKASTKFTTTSVPHSGGV